MARVLSVCTLARCRVAHFLGRPLCEVADAVIEVLCGAFSSDMTAIVLASTEYYCKPALEAIL